ncbi:MAG: hypothetical protein K2H38_02460 [Muribaculaceae bacterium]|nr:hypothetical protein [Muribaculaceae bacterium]MDE7349876.1 hypothetical protein [Muribaculaceae bacterium]
MKKLLYLLLVLPFAMMISSCSSDKDLPNVDITLTFDNAAVKDGAVYVIQDSVFSMTGITVKAVDTKQQAAIANIRYFWNGIPAPGLTWSPLPMEIDMAQMPQPENGENILGLRATLLETDKSIAYTALNVPIIAVENEEALPDGVTLGEASFTFSNTPQSDKE